MNNCEGVLLVLKSITKAVAVVILRAYSHRESDDDLRRRTRVLCCLWPIYTTLLYKLRRNSVCHLLTHDDLVFLIGKIINKACLNPHLCLTMKQVNSSK